VGDSESKYTLSVSGYNGTAGDSLATIQHNGQRFSTRDQDNDVANDYSCVVHYKGGWWYGACHDANLNGLYHGDTRTTYADGVSWYTWRGHSYSLKFTEMKLREN